MTETIAIAAATNNAYAQHCAVMVASLLGNTPNPERIQVHILDCGLDQIEIKRISQTCKQLGGQASVFYSVNSTLMECFPETRHTLSTYARIFIGSLFPKEMDRVIYLDSDLVVLGDVADLFSWDVGNNLIASARDFSTTAEKRLSTFPTRYFNSGVLVIDLKKWRDQRIEEKLINYLKTTKDKLDFADQDALNVIINDRWEELPPRWNAQLGVFTTRPERWEPLGFRESELIEAMKDPAIVHYINNSKPWLFSSSHPLKRLYWKYLKATAYPKTGYPDLNRKTILKKVFGIQRTAKGIWCRRQFKGAL